MLTVAADDATDRTRAVERLYRDEGARMWRTLVMQTGDRELASDACSEAFAQLLARWDAVRDPRAWVWKAALLIADRASSRRPVPNQSEQIYDLPEPLIDLARGLATLSPMQRKAIALRYVDDRSIADIARLLGSSPSAIAVHLFRGRRRLTEFLEMRDD
jgi:RNA polymerase sigma-70 factor (ECF subfamily)